MIQDNSSNFDDNDVDTIKFFEGVAECLMNDSDTIKDGKIRAKNLAEQNAQQKIVDYIRDFLEFRYLTFPDDEILSIANEIFKISNINYGMKDSGGNEMIIQSAVIAQIDDNDIMNCLVRFFNERTELKSANETLNDEIDDLKSQIEPLRKEIETLRKLRAENDDLKSQIEPLHKEIEMLSKENKAFRVENDDLKRKIDELTPQIITKDKVALANQKSSEASKLHSKQDYEGALKLFDEAIELNPYADNLYHNRGGYYYTLKQYEKSIQDFSKALELYPNAAWLYQSRGNCYKELNQYEKAIQDYSKIIELSPNYGLYYKMRGECYKGLGEKAKAKADFKKAKELGYNY